MNDRSLRRRLFELLCPTLLVVLTACSSVRPFYPDTLNAAEGFLQDRQTLREVNQWQLNARLLIDSEQGRERLNVQWSYSRPLPGAPVEQQLHLYDRLGRTVLVVNTDAGGAWLIHSRLEQKSAWEHNLSELIKVNTGFNLPADDLPVWMLALGQPEEKPPQAKHIYYYGHWQVEYLNFADFDGWLMPERMRVYTSGLELNITISRWKLPTHPSIKNSSPLSDSGRHTDNALFLTHQPVNHPLILKSTVKSTD